MNTHKFFGVCGNCYKLDSRVFEALEDESDGYRSMLGSIEIREDEYNLTFFPDPLGEVTIKDVDDGYFQGWILIDVEDGHEWLRVGTSNYDDYYPCFVFSYNPKEPKASWNNFVQGTWQ